MDVIVHAHARVLDATAEVSVDADTPLPIGSVFKLFVLVSLASRIGDGSIDPGERLVVDASKRTSGPTGLSLMRDPVRMSLRDLAMMMMSVSDNAATDAILERIGIHDVNRVLRELGMVHSRVTSNCRGLLESLARDLDVSLDELYPALVDADPALLARTMLGGETLDAARTTRSTPRELTSLLAAIWQDTAVPPLEAAWCRHLLKTQIFHNWLGAAFAGRAAVAGKSGTLPTLFGEAGVVAFPDGFTVALAVFIRSEEAGLQAEAARPAILGAARDLVARLRG